MGVVVWGAADNERWMVVVKVVLVVLLLSAAVVPTAAAQNEQQTTTTIQAPPQPHHHHHCNKQPQQYTTTTTTNSQQALNVERGSPDGVTQACKLFQEAAGTFAYLKDAEANKVDAPVPADLSGECCALMERLMLAQAQVRCCGRSRV